MHGFHMLVMFVGSIYTIRDTQVYLKVSAYFNSYFYCSSRFHFNLVSRLFYFFSLSFAKQNQCGFKLFGRRTAARVFAPLHVERWAFDLELLFVALKFYDTPVREVAIDWHEVDGSKLSVFWASLQMARDLARIRFNYTFGIWQVPPEDDDDVLEIVSQSIGRN